MNESEPNDIFSEADPIEVQIVSGELDSLDSLTAFSGEFSSNSDIDLYSFSIDTASHIGVFWNVTDPVDRVLFRINLFGESETEDLIVHGGGGGSFSLSEYGFFSSYLEAGDYLLTLNQPWSFFSDTGFDYKLWVLDDRDWTTFVAPETMMLSSSGQISHGEGTTQVFADRYQFVGQIYSPNEAEGIDIDVYILDVRSPGDISVEIKTDINDFTDHFAVAVYNLETKTVFKTETFTSDTTFEFYASNPGEYGFAILDNNTNWVVSTPYQLTFSTDLLATSTFTNSLATGTPVILGEPVEYETLTVDTSTIKDSDGLGVFSYQWKRDGEDITDANSNRYVLNQADVDAVISVEVSFVDANHSSERLLSDSTRAVDPYFGHYKTVVVVVDDFSTWAMEDELIASMTTIYDYAEINYIHSTLGVIDTAYPGYINVDEYGLENVNIGGVDLLKSTGAYQRSESATPNHGDWVLKALCESLDNPNDVEIIALDCDFTTFQDMTYLFADNNYENAYLSAFNDVIEDDTFYFMAGLNASFGGEDISEFLPTISSILNSDSIVVQASPNVSQQGTNWGNVFPNVINVGAWNIDEDRYFLGSEQSQAESIDIYADGFVESSSLGWDSNFGTSFAAPKVMAEILNLYDELILADLNSGNETYDPSAQVDLTPEEETLVTNWFVDEISSEYILSGPNFISNPLAVLDSTIELSGTEPSLIEGFTFGSGQLITNAYSADISPVDISSFNTKVWATESESLAVVIGTDGADQSDIGNELTNQQTHASVFVGNGDDTVTDSSGDDFIMFGSGSDTLNTSSGADLIYKAGSGSLTINGSPDGVWSHGYYAKNVGTEFGIGTNNLLSLAGLNRSHDFLFIDGAVDAVTVNLDSGSSSRGAAIFSEDVYSPMNAYIDDVYAYFSANQWSVVDGFTSMYDYDGSGGSFTLNGSDYGDVFDLTTEHYSVTEALPNYSMTYNGLGGDDVIWGFGFATIDGGAGNDVINGGLGANTLTGGTGFDIFEFTATSGNDTITDFNTDEDELHFYYRKGEAEESAVASIENGVVTWDAVTVDLGDSSLAISDLNITYEMI